MTAYFAERFHRLCPLRLSSKLMPIYLQVFPYILFNYFNFNQNSKFKIRNYYCACPNLIQRSFAFNKSMIEYGFGIPSSILVSSKRRILSKRFAGEIESFNSKYLNGRMPLNSSG